MSSLANRTRWHKSPALDALVDFPPDLTAKLGNVDSRNITTAVVLATLDRWKITHADGVAYCGAGRLGTSGGHGSAPKVCGSARQAKAR